MIRPDVEYAVGLRDQLAAILRDSAVPMSTARLAVCSGAPWVEFVFNAGCRLLHPVAQRCGWQVVACGGDGNHRLAEPPTTVTYRLLVVLEKAGTIVRVYDACADRGEEAQPAGAGVPYIAASGGNRCIYWQYVPNSVDDAFAALISPLGER